MANSLLDPSNLAEWLHQIRLDFDSPDAFLQSLFDWVAAAPASVIVTAAGITVAALAFTRRPSVAAFIVLIALGALGAVGTVL